MFEVLAATLFWFTALAIAALIIVLFLEGLARRDDTNHGGGNWK